MQCRAFYLRSRRRAPKKSCGTGRILRAEGARQTLVSDMATILCIDDEVETAHVRRLLLESEGYEVVEAQAATRQNSSAYAFILLECENAFANPRPQPNRLAAHRDSQASAESPRRH